VNYGCLATLILNRNMMTQQLPPPTLAATWLDIIHSEDMPQEIINKRNKLICYYFGSVELAYAYVDKNIFSHRHAS
tara:strand:+ start:302 stop:529 length:228 start_codon:yes stop_codon:yes gene_type:complete